MRMIRCVLPLLAAIVLVGGHAGANLRRQLSQEDVVQQSALIAHVRVAGDVVFGNRTVQVVEILDSARGPAQGQLVMIACDRERFDGAWLPKKLGGQFILFAERNDQGLYRPLREEWGALPVQPDGAIADVERMPWFLPPQTPPTVRGAMAHLRAICQRQQAKLRVRLNNDDIAGYEPNRPVRVQITIENIGEGDLRFQNHIEYEYLRNRFVDQERQLKMQQESLAPPVKICVRRIGRLHTLQQLEEIMEQLSINVVLGPRERASASFDLGEEHDIREGGTFAVWAELGGTRSPAVTLELPRSEEAVEMMEMLKELDDDDGPFHIERQLRRVSRAMPAVEPVVEGAAIEAALAYWFSDRLSGRHYKLDEQTDEVVVLRSAHITPEFAPAISGVQFLASDADWRNDGKPAELTTSHGPAIFHWRTVRIQSVHVQGAQATVEVIQNERHNLGGSGAKINLRRNGGTWHVDGEVLMWQS